MSQSKRSSDGTPEGKAPSLDALYAQHARQVLAWALRASNGRQSWAEDVTHDVFLQAWTHRAWLREDDVKGWLYRVTQNLVFSRLRREARLGAVLRLFGAGTSDTVAGADAHLEQRERVARATKALDALPGQERVVMAMKTLDDLSQREIAKVLSLSEGYVSKLLARAQARLEARGWRVE